MKAAIYARKSTEQIRRGGGTAICCKADRVGDQLRRAERMDR